MLREIRRKTKNYEGFTLAELLIVVAIIAVLVAVSIPIFSTQLEKSREATDLANIRAAYAEVMVDAVQEDTNSDLYDATTHTYEKVVYLKQKKDGWECNADKLNIGGVLHTDSVHWKGDAKANGYCTVTYNDVSRSVTLIWSGYTVMQSHYWEDSGGYLTSRDYNIPGGWPSSAIPEYISAKNGTGQKLVAEAITADKYPALNAYITGGGGYEIGIYYADKNGKVLWDSGGLALSQITDSEWDIKSSSLSNGDDINIAIQFFKMKSGTNRGLGVTEVSDAEARELEKLISIKKTSTP